MARFYIHHTGFFLTAELIPNRTHPYLLSTEASFCYRMLDRYYASFGAPFSKPNPCFLSHLMEHSAYYSLAELPVHINYLFYIKNKETLTIYILLAIAYLGKLPLMNLILIY